MEFFTGVSSLLAGDVAPQVAVPADADLLRLEHPVQVHFAHPVRPVII